MSFSVKTPEDSPGFMLWQLTCQWQREQRSALKKLGLTHAQFVVLASLLWLSMHSEDCVTQKNIVDHSKIDKMSMSDLVATLEQKKLLKRMPHKKDGRADALTLTAKGRERALKAIPIVEEIDVMFFKKEAERVGLFIRSLQYTINLTQEGHQRFITTFGF